MSKESAFKRFFCGRRSLFGKQKSKTNKDEEFFPSSPCSSKISKSSSAKSLRRQRSRELCNASSFGSGTVNGPLSDTGSNADLPSECRPQQTICTNSNRPLSSTFDSKDDVRSSSSSIKNMLCKALSSVKLYTSGKNDEFSKNNKKEEEDLNACDPVYFLLKSAATKSQTTISTISLVNSNAPLSPAPISPVASTRMQHRTNSESFDCSIRSQNLLAVSPGLGYDSRSSPQQLRRHCSAYGNNGNYPTSRASIDVVRHRGRSHRRQHF